MLTRRAVLLLSTFAGLLVAVGAGASVARALSLGELARASDRAVLGTPLEAKSQWETVGRQRRIVTYSRVRVDAPIAGASSEPQLWVRTLGGNVGDVGQVVHGEAFLILGEPAVLFLRPASDGALVVSGMAQGHYPVRVDAAGERRLAPSPRLSELTGSKHGAVRELAGQPWSQARQKVERAFRDAR